MEHIAHIWPSMADLASDLGCPYQTVASWKLRGRIPAAYDLDLVRAAALRGHVLRLEDLALARGSRRASDASAQGGVAAE